MSYYVHDTTESLHASTKILLVPALWRASEIEQLIKLTAVFTPDQLSIPALRACENHCNEYLTRQNTSMG